MDLKPPVKGTESEQEIRNYFSSSTAFVPPSTSVLHNIESISIEYSIIKNLSLYILFNCYVFTTKPDLVRVYIYVNNIEKGFFGMRVSTDSTEFLGFYS
ncbi:MAG: hypothetical protein EU549_04175 [Promethearchaeota archaeon]|nr:MAG: hypothetical protein EU549_04175 [Candidatus Lokiarchaeota archaeon]